MVKYDYSLDVGQSMETDEKLKQKEQEETQGCCKVSQESLEVGDEPVEQKKEPKTEPEKEKEEKLEQEAPNPQKEASQEPKEEKLEPEVPNSRNEVSRKVEIKPISFEKAKLISDFEGEKKEEPKKESPKEETTEEPEEDDPEEEQKYPEEDEQDVDEFLEDSFSKETKKYETYNNKPKEEAVSKKRNWKLPALIFIIILLIGFFGYFYLTEKPTGTVTAAPEIELQELPVIIPNMTEPPELEPTTHNITEEPEPNKQNISDALEMLSLALKDQ